MSPTPRAGWLLVAIALGALALPPRAGVAVALGALGALALDVVVARRTPRIVRRLPRVIARGVPARLEVEGHLGPPDERREDEPPRGRVTVRQPAVPDVTITPGTAPGRLEAEVVARRRGRHELPPVAARRVGPLGLGAWSFTGEGRAELLVYPDLPRARHIAQQVRTRTFREEGSRPRGPLGLGTEFESIRDYLPDDDVRQINWSATAHLGRPMSNQYRVEQDRDVVCVVDTGRLMAAPVGDRTRLDAAVDAAVAVALAADALGDRCGLVAFDAEIRRQLPVRRAGGRDVTRALFDLEPRAVDSDYDLAFRTVGRSKRSLVVVLTDLVDEAAAAALLEATPVLGRRHAVVVASVTDPDLVDAVDRIPVRPLDVHAAAVALDLLDARARVAHRLRRAAAEVVDASPDRLSEACVAAYLRLKSRGRV